MPNTNSPAANTAPIHPAQTLTRADMFDAKNPAEVFARFQCWMGRVPEPAELRGWVNTILGPWHIDAEILACCG